MDKIEFSVIIPLYNKENKIKKTIESVLAQTYSNFELLVVNDGSSDNSRGVLETITDRRIVIIDQENAGVSSARNNGIKQSRGKYICFLDADDLWECNFLETVKELFIKYPEAKMACPSYQVIYGNRVLHPKWRAVDLEKDCLVRDFFEMATAPFWVCNSSCVAIEANVLKKMEYWFPENETVYEDFDLWIRIGSKYPVAHSNTICATYQRVTETNARKTHSNKIVYSKTYMNTLENFLLDTKYTKCQKKYIKEIIDRRVVPYIFSLYLVGERNTAKNILKKWTPSENYKKYAAILKLLRFCPGGCLNLIQKIRLGVF